MPRSLRSALRPHEIDVKAILTYHSIDDSGSVVSVSPAELDRHFAALKSRGVRIVPLTSLTLVPPDVDAVAITFDDGFENFASAAAPVLLAHTAPATVFIIPSCVGGANDWESTDSRAAVPRLSLMSWGQIAQVRSQGFDIGGHSLTHRSMKGLDAVLLEREVNESAASIKERVGADPVAFAFPYGDYDDAAIATVSRRYSIACTTDFGLLSDADSPHSLPRLDMYYFRSGKMLGRFGSLEFKAFVAGRRMIRRLGALVRGGLVGSKG
ncbi:MAG: polysaccharide deacetylase family protein [Gemmatimonadales bacterium]